MKMRWLWSCAVCVGALAAPAAQAQDTDTFDIDGGLHDQRGTLQLAWPELGSPDGSYGGLGLVLDKNPLVLEYPDETVAVVGTRFSSRFAGGHTFGDRFRLDVDVPVYPAVMVDSDYHFAMGDIRVGGLVPLDLLPSDKLLLGVSPSLRFPTAGRESYLTNKGLAVQVVGALAGRAGDVAWTTNLGLDLSRKVELADQQKGSGLLFGAGANYPLPLNFRVGAEIDGIVNLAGGLGSQYENPVEWHIYGMKPLQSGLQIATGVGSGLMGGIGAPAYRFFLGLSWRTPDLDDSDQDGDGILDRNDRCPLAAEDMDGFEDDDGCPDPDNDNDKIFDVDDACPDEPGPITTQGCPDRDGDGLADGDDECPDEPGPIAAGGCPDRDGDRVPDYRDDCPDSPADPRVDPRRSNGCPKRVFISTEKIEILEKIFFEVNKATIKNVSHELLREIGQVLEDNPDIRLVEVQGHTDSTASDEYNLNLSQHRAEAVVEFLVTECGVASERLEAKGYGETRPIETNLTEDGKAANRRVEFVILEQ